MTKQDIDKASAALTGAINFFSPAVVALNHAGEVFDVLSNAIKFKDHIEKEVDALKATLEPLKAAVEASKAAITANDAAAAEAKAQALADIADAKAQADAEVKSIKAAVVDRTKKAVADSEAKIAEVTAAADAANTRFDATLKGQEEYEATLQADIDTLEAKLAALREQAQKFAASLVG